MWTAAGHAERCKALQSLSAGQVAQRVWVQDNQPGSRGSAATSHLLLLTAHTAWSRPAPSCTEQCAMSHLSITSMHVLWVPWVSPGSQPKSYPSPPQPRLHHHTNTSTRSHMHTHTPTLPHSLKRHALKTGTQNTRTAKSCRKANPAISYRFSAATESSGASSQKWNSVPVRGGLGSGDPSTRGLTCRGVVWGGRAGE